MKDRVEQNRTDLDYNFVGTFYIQCVMLLLEAFIGYY